MDSQFIVMWDEKQKVSILAQQQTETSPLASPQQPQQYGGISEG